MPASTDEHGDLVRVLAHSADAERVSPPEDVIAAGAQPHVPLCASCTDAYRNGIEPGESACDVRHDAEMFPAVRDSLVHVGRALVGLPEDAMDRAIRAGERALSAGAILDPTLYRDAGRSLDQQVKFLKLVRQFRRDVIELVGDL